MLRLTFLLCMTCGLLGGVAGCVVYDPALVTRDAARDTGSTACNHRAPPARPSGTDTSEPGEVSFGLRDVVLNQDGDLWRTLGYDVDDRCTTMSDPTSECTPGGRTPTDGDDGIDNEFGHSLYPLVEAAVDGLEARARMAQMEGRGLPILRMRGWNRTPNDPVVDVTIAAAVFSTTFAGAVAPDVVIHGPDDVELASGGPVPAPIWDGNDWVWVRTDAFLSGNLEAPLVRDESAYVVDNVVVATLPERVDIVFPTDTVGVLVRLTDAVATGTLSADGTRLENVIVAGRWSITDLLSTAENVGICQGTGEYNVLESRLGTTADVRSRPPAPGDPVLSCDALSIGVQFTGFRMRIAGITEGLEITNVCTGIGDGGVPDAGPVDAGPVDAGTLDAGTVDAATTDAGVDAGPPDTGPRDAGTDANTDAAT